MRREGGREGEGEGEGEREEWNGMELLNYLEASGTLPLWCVQ
eukprot:COSAG03_NODE_318_length_9038_cov_19.855017_3_plen_42_part_00